MSENNECPIAVHEQRFKNIEDDVHDIKGNVLDLTNKVTKMDKDNAIANTNFAIAIENLSGLPKILEGLDKTMIAIQFKSNQHEDDIDAIKTQLNTVDDEGKINIRAWIRDNWLSAVLAIGGVIAIVANLSK